MGLIKWWFGPSLKIYPTIKMTGLTGKQIWRKYRKQRLTAAKYGLYIHSPVPGEGIKCDDSLLKDRRGKGATEIWKKDRNQLDNVNAIVFEKSCMTSQGSIFELVKGRGSRWKITVFIHPKPGFIAREQADICAKSIDIAYRKLSEQFSSRHKRFKWRIKMLFKSIPKHIVDQIKELFL